VRQHARRPASRRDGRHGGGVNDSDRNRHPDDCTCDECMKELEDLQKSANRWTIIALVMWFFGGPIIFIILAIIGAIIGALGGGY